MTSNKNSTRYFSSKQEKRVAKAVNGRTVSNSGAPLFVAGDVTTEDWLIECKTKTFPSESMSIKREWLEKNEEEAFAMGKSHSALCFSFGDTHNDKQYFIINEELFKKLVDSLEEEDA